MFDISWDVPPPEGPVSVAKASMVGGKTCINFSNTPLQPNFHVDFGEAKRGRLTKLLELRNATNAEITIELEKFPKLESLSIGKTRWSILPGESVEEALTWEPSQEGKFREKLAFVHQHNGRKRRIEVILYGNGLVTQKKMKQKRPMKHMKKIDRKPRSRTISTTSSKSSGVLTQMQNTQNITLNLTAPAPKAAKPAKHAAKPTFPAKRKVVHQSSKENVASNELSNDAPTKLLPKKRLRLTTSAEAKAFTQAPVKRKVLFDKLWMVKQEQGFQAWLNYLLTPSHEENTTSAHAVLAQKQRHAATLRQAFKLSSSPKIEAVQFEVEREIASGGLSIRKDKQLFKDLGLRNLFLDMLCCYNPIWLRLGLETVTGQSADSYNVKHLRRFIEARVLNDPDIESKYKETKKGLFENEEYTAELRVFTLRHFLMLVFFLDNAKLDSLIDHPSCLFVIDNKLEIKSSQAMLITFAKEFLSGEGNVLRHLAHSCSYKVFHQQQKLDEFDFQVGNLSTDLRNGIRLTRVVELLTANKERSLSRRLRLPAVSRLQKLHNVGVAFGELQAQGLDLSFFESKSVKRPITHKDIVDGNRGKTLVVLWKMIVRWKLSMIVSEKDLQSEISAVRALHGPTARSIIAGAEEEQERLQQIEELELGGSYLNGHCSSEESAALEACLLQWAQVVCAHHGVAVSNFTTSLANGVAIAALIKHYHPRLVDFTEVSQGTESASVAKNKHDRRLYLAGLEGERHNFALINSGVEALGCIPLLLPEFDSENIPEKKLMVLFLAYLGSRLISARDEIRAAQKIQATWATWSLRRKRAAVLCIQRNVRPLIKVWRQRTIAAVRVLQRSYRRACVDNKKRRFRRGIRNLQAVVRGHLSRIHNNPRKDIIFVQSAARRWLAKRQFLRLNSARKIQSAARGFLVRQTLVELSAHATKLQAWFRGACTCHMYNGVRELVTIVQSVVRRHQASAAYSAMKKSVIVLQNMLRLRWKKKSAAVLIQRQARRSLAMRAFVRSLKATVLLQSWSRALPDQWRLKKMRSACVKTQALFRGIQSRRLHNPRVQLVKIQATVRALLAKRLMQRLLAARRLQAWFRCRDATHSYCLAKHSSVQIQAWFRGRMCFSFAHYRSVVVRCQSQFRMVFGVRRFQAKKSAVTRIACCYRQRILTKRFLQLKYAVKTLQAFMRYKKQQRCTVQIQTMVRRMLLRRRFLHAKACAILIQSHARGIAVRLDLAHKAAACARIQARVRGMLDRAHNNPIAALSTLQRNGRMWLARQRWMHLQKACLSVQANIRMFLARQKYVRLVKRVVKLQSVVRSAKQQAVFHRTRWLIVECQAVVRRHFACRQSHERKHAQRLLVRFGKWIVKTNKSIVLQKAVRMYLQRKVFNATIHKTKRIQAVYRGHICRSDFLKTRLCVVRIQAIWRSSSSRKAVNPRRDLIRSQAYCRGWLVRLRAKKDRGAIHIQKAVRMWLAQCRLKSAVNAASRIQARFRCWFISELYNSIRYRVIVVQAVVRRRIQSKQYRRCRQSCISIQATLRCFKQKQRHILLRRSVMCLQQRHRYIITRKCIVHIQTAYRSQAARKRFAAVKQGITSVQARYRRNANRRGFLHMRSSAVLVQALVRGQQSRRRHNPKRALLLVQAFARRCVAQTLFHRKLNSIIKLQAWRRTVVLNDMYCFIRTRVILLQCVTRRYLCQKQFRTSLQACVLLQAQARKLSARTTYLQQRNAAKVLCRFGRLTLRHIAARKIQSHVRTLLQQKRFKFTVIKLVCLQSAWRRFAEHRRFQRTRRAAVRIQSRYRGMYDRRWNNPRKALVIIQALARQLYAKNLVCRSRSAVVIQKIIRGYSARAFLNRSVRAAVVVQAKWRQHVASSAFLLHRSQALVVQSWWRMASKHQAFLHVVNCTVVLQRNARRFRCQKEFCSLRQAVTKAQAVVRGHLSRMFCNPLRSLLLIQAVVRSWHVRRRLAKVAASVRLQAWIRKVQGQFLYAEKYKKVIVVQAFLRGANVRHMFTAVREMVVVIQSVVRRHQAIGRFNGTMQKVQMVQIWWKGVIHCRRYAQFRCSVIRLQARVRGKIARRQKNPWTASIHIQARIRGWIVRKNFIYKKHLRVARKKRQLRKETANFTVKLGDRTRKAIELLQRGVKWSQIMYAINELHVCTRYSKECCLAVLRTGSVAVIVDLLKGLNRSDPHVKVLIKALEVLVFISAAHDMFTYVEVDDLPTILLEKMQFGFKKESFIPALTLLEKISAHPEGRSAMCHAEIIKRLKALRSRSNRNKIGSRQQERITFLITQLCKGPA